MKRENPTKSLWLLKFAISDLRSRLSALKIFLACLILGVTLVAATANLYGVIEQSLLADTRALLGGDVELDSGEPLPDDALEWILATGSVSLVREFDTIVSDRDGDGFFRAEILVPDAAYPLYGALELTPDEPRKALTARKENLWGAIIDPLLAERQSLSVGDQIEIGAATFRISGLIQKQPDRSLNANWRGLPIMISDQAVESTGLIRPGSRIDYEYRVRTDQDLDVWLEEFERAFPDTRWDITTFAERSERISERLDQIATGLILIAFTMLFIGGLGVANSIHAYLDEKLGTIATLFWLPSPHLGFLFLLAVILLWALLEGLITGLRRAAKTLEDSDYANRKFARRLALANLHGPDSPLRAILLSLGTALTLVVVCTMMVTTLLRAIETTIPAESPALILYDVFPDQRQPLEAGFETLDSSSKLELLPLVRSRLATINQQPIAELLADNPEARREAMGDEYKLSYLSDNPERLELVEGAWWRAPAPEGAPVFMAMEDREAYQLGLGVGDKVEFTAQHKTITAEIRAIYRQKGLQTRFWFEGILQEGALDELISLYVGAFYQSDEAAKASQQWLSQNIPNVITLRTADWLETAGDLLNKAAAGLAAIAAVSLMASLLVLTREWSLCTMASPCQPWPLVMPSVIGWAPVSSRVFDPNWPGRLFRWRLITAIAPLMARESTVPSESLGR